MKEAGGALKAKLQTIKWITMLLSFCLLFGMTACSTGKTEASGITEQNSENHYQRDFTVRNRINGRACGC